MWRSDGSACSAGRHKPETLKSKEIKSSRESCLALFDVLALGIGTGLATEVDGDAHEQSAFVDEEAGDVHGDQQQKEDHN